jgi:hypothetical protein
MVTEEVGTKRFEKNLAQIVPEKLEANCSRKIWNKRVIKELEKIVTEEL